MYSFRRLALLLVLGLPAAHALPAQSSSSSSNPAPQDQAQPPAATQTQQQMSVQARIRARRAQRRSQAIHDAYSHLYEAYVGAAYLRYFPGPHLQRVNEYSWNVGLTRYYSERLGVTVDARGTYGTPFVGLSEVGNGSLTKPAISQYSGMIGPTYRFYLKPKYSVSGRVMGGIDYGNFSGDTNGQPPATLGLYSNGSTYAFSASIVGEYNLTPAVGIRIAPEYLATGFGSTVQNNRGFTGGLVYRFGKQ